MQGSGDPIGTVVQTNVNSIVDFDVNYAQNYIVDKNIELKYGIGMGYRSWRRELFAWQVETYKWFSLRPMLGAKFAINKDLDIGLALEYQYGINPVMDESTHGEFKLGGADIIEVSLPIKYRYNDNIKLLIEYVYQEQTIKKSNIVDGYYEPESTANNQYLKLGVAFKF